MTQPRDLIWGRWEEVDRVLEAALEHPPQDWDRFLTDACSGDADLRRAVRDLLDRVSAPDRALDGPGRRVIGALWPSPDAQAPEPSQIDTGVRVGRYRVVGELGRGGMATVYEAERADGAFQQRVALKVLHRGLDTDELVGRFVSERQILSGLEHPHIARLLDGGATDDGRPYLVTELVQGESITEWADHHRLPVHDRLRLLLQVAEAVQFAHRRLVVHRDLKPSNIFVDGEGRVKLLDFGIAKLLDQADGDSTGLTRAGVRPLTPGYASPELLRGAAVTTASDVYQIGLLSYELLTGKRPFTGTGLELEAAILRGQVPRPSEVCGPAVGRALRGDLDTILFHCLRVEPEQRYRSVEAVADDIRRYLEGRPISARPASTMYRLRKFARRKPWAAPVAAALTLALAGYIATLVAHARTLEFERNEAQAQTKRAQAQTERAQELQAFLVDLFRMADPYGSPDPSRNREITVVEALDIGAARVRNELSERPLLQAGLLSAIADVYTNLDMRAVARPLIEEAMAIRLREGEDRSPEQLDDLGNLMLVAVGPDSAIAIGERRIALERDIHGPDHPRFAQALLALANPQFQLGRFDEALTHREEAIRILRGAGPPAAGDLAEALGLISNSYRFIDRLDDAEDAARAAVAIRERLHGAEHASTATSSVHLALLLSDRQRNQEAIAIYRSAIPVLERTLGPEHFITVNTRNNLGVALMEEGESAGAEQTYREILEIRVRQAPEGRSQQVAGTLQNLAVAALRQGRRADAEQLIVKAYDMYRDVLPQDHYLIAFPLLTLTEIQLEAGNVAGAESSAREARRLLLAGLPAGHYATAVAECRLGSALARQSRLAEAGQWIEPALRSIRESVPAPAHFEEECARTMQAFVAAGGVRRDG